MVIQKLRNAMAAVCLILALSSVQELQCQSWISYKKEIIEGLSRVEGWCPRDKAERMMELIKNVSPSVCVEIGVFGGSSFIPTTAALNFNKKGIAYGIDPWSVDPCLEGNEGVNYEWWSRVDLDKILIGFIKHMHDRKLDANYAIMRMTSKDALPFFKDGSIDILHIDGNHAEDSALFDVKHWMSKVRSGGYIWFDDANWQSTSKAVQYLRANCDLDPSSSVNDAFLLFRKR